MNNGVVGLNEGKGISQAVKTKNLMTTLLDSSSVKPLWLTQTLPILYLQIVAVYAYVRLSNTLPSLVKR